MTTHRTDIPSPLYLLILLSSVAAPVFGAQLDSSGQSVQSSLSGGEPPAACAAATDEQRVRVARTQAARSNRERERIRRGDTHPEARPGRAPVHHGEHPRLPGQGGTPECKSGADGKPVCGFNCKTGARGRVACAELPDMECMSGADGIVVCGYVCKTGAKGRVACADTLDGVCASGADGAVVCTKFWGNHQRERNARGRALPECKSGADGRVACGYNCKTGAKGQAGCADTPDGVCGSGADGYVVCTQFGRIHGGRRAARSGSRPECKSGSNGRVACGYNCKTGSGGHAACADTPDGICASGADGTVACTQLTY